MAKKKSAGRPAAKSVKRPSQDKPSIGLSAWWRNKKLRYGTLSCVAALIVLVAALPMTRDTILNSMSIRVETSFTVVDGTTGLPLQNAQVKLGSLSARTGHDGIVKFAHLKLGTYTIMVSKIAFATLNRPVTLGLGDNSLGNLPVKATGSQYRFTVVDYVTGKPVIKAEANSGPSSAPADNKGKIVLTVNRTSAVMVPVTISAAGYRDEQPNVPGDNTQPIVVQMVPLGKDIFVSQASGNYDVYKSDLDGQNTQLLLAGTGLENSNITLVPSLDQEKVALIATRDDIRDAGGYLLYALVIIDVNNGSTQTLDHGDYVEAIGWLGTRLVYEETVAGASTANPQRTEIVSYNYLTNTKTQLAMAAQFNAVTIAQGNVYYAVAATDTVNPAALYEISADGSNRHPVFGQEVWTILRRDYNTFDLETPNGWYSYTLGGNQPKQTTAPANYQNLSFFDSPDGSKSVWEDDSGSNGVLLSRDIKSGKDTTLTTQVGLTTPIVWINNNYIIYRVSSAQETADYVISSQGGNARKVNDVVSTFGANQD